MFIISREALRLRKPKEKKNPRENVIEFDHYKMYNFFMTVLLTVVKNNRLREDLCQYII